MTPKEGGHTFKADATQPQVALTGQEVIARKYYYRRKLL